MNSRRQGPALRGGAAALLVLAVIATGAPWSVADAGDGCCAKRACCASDDTGCAGRVTVDRVGCCAPQRAPAAAAAASPAATSTGPTVAATAAIHVASLGRTAARDRLLLADRSVAEGPPAPVPLFTVHASLLL